MTSPRASFTLCTPAASSLHQRRFKSLSELDLQSLPSTQSKANYKQSETRASSQLLLFPESGLRSPSSCLPTSLLPSPKSLFPGSGRSSPKSHISRLADRLGTRDWVKSASGGKLRHLLTENVTVSSQKGQRKWDTFLGYLGAPYSRGVTAYDLTEKHARLTISRADEFGAHTKPLCWKEMPKHAKEATVAQALLYLKLRDSRFSKDEAVKHSSGFRFKTDTGLHRLKGTENPFVFNGVQVRVPVSDPEHKYTPYTTVESHRDFEMLSRAYEKFTRKYKVVDGEFEEKEDSFSRMKLRDFQESPKPYWMERREVTPEQVPERQEAKEATVQPQEDVSLSEEQDTVTVSSSETSEVSRKDPGKGESPKAEEAVDSAVAKVEEFAGGSLVFRSLNPKKPQLPNRSVARHLQGRKSTDGKQSNLLLFERRNRRASSFIPLRAMFK